MAHHEMSATLSAFATRERRSPDQLGAQLFTASPTAVRALIVEQVVRPMNILSILTVANGIFVRLAFRERGGHIELADVRQMNSRYVGALARQVCKSHMETLRELASTLAEATDMTDPILVAQLLASIDRSRRDDPLADPSLRVTADNGAFG